MCLYRLCANALETLLDVIFISNLRGRIYYFHFYSWGNLKHKTKVTSNFPKITPFLRDGPRIGIYLSDPKGHAYNPQTIFTYLFECALELILFATYLQASKFPFFWTNVPKISFSSITIQIPNPVWFLLIKSFLLSLLQVQIWGQSMENYHKFQISWTSEMSLSRAPQNNSCLECKIHSFQQSFQHSLHLFLSPHRLRLFF